MGAEHTLGPWRAVKQEDGDWEVRAILNDQNHYVLIAFDLDEAVARRMAATPDMLAAGSLIDRYLLVIESAVRNADPSQHRAVLDALIANRAAIAKATEPTAVASA